jgi:Tfp pilus assembly protein PilE
MKGDAMKRKQGGITLIGFVLVLMVVCFFGYMAMVLGPAYSEYYGVCKAMRFVAAAAKPNSTDFEELRRGLDRQFNVGYVESVTGKDAKLVRDKTGNTLSIDYEVRKGFVYNIDFVLKFKYAVPLGSATAGD